jgi:Protein of unknown function (DUF3568)
MNERVARRSFDFRRLALVTWVLPCLLTTTVGCAPPLLFANAGVSLAEAGTSMFMEGELRAAWRRPLEVMEQGVAEAMNTLGYRIESRTERENYIYIRGVEIDGTEIEVRLRRSSEIVTSISIRVGLLGDQAVSRLILEEAERVMQRREKAAATPTPAAGVTSPQR